MSDGRQGRKEQWWAIPLVLLLSPLILALLACALFFFVLSTISLHILIWSCWCPRGRDINWSHHKRWRLSLARLAFFHFGGYREFNPLAVVFRPFRRTRTFRFWKAFREYKHGHLAQLRKIENEFFGFLGVGRGGTIAEPSAGGNAR